MKYLHQQPGHFWWTRNPRYIIYFLREFSGVLIAIYILTLLTLYAILFYKSTFIGMTNHPLYGVAQSLHAALNGWIGYVGLAGALIHTLTWLYVMPQLLPIKLSALQQKTAYILLIAAWLSLSYGILQIISTP